MANIRTATEQEKQAIFEAYRFNPKMSYNGVAAYLKKLGYIPFSQTWLENNGYITQNKCDKIEVELGGNKRSHHKKDSDRNIEYEQVADAMRVKKFSIAEASHRQSAILWHGEVVQTKDKFGETTFKEQQFCLMVYAIVPRIVLPMKARVYPISYIVVKSLGLGEKKEHWEQLLNVAKDRGLGKVIAMDTDTNFADAEGLKIVHLEKDNKHPYNQEVEGFFGSIAKMITANAKMISKMPIDEAKRYVEQLINFQVFREIAEEQKIELTVPNIQKS